ncbi:chemotaxis protein CheB [Geodermatophilus sp. DF01-2]|uniref:chemotaxis protein CheB n=1 Tax=Geodermatophilus sp. DF01-2 TaxID=2559610 RepID=UPI001073E5E1|nr:chemotaxis protein CheB [Geodermatophilus sp. DF01_2]TFV57431.1 chemotaxis protein CheB [Geodermatophilus sp. DF01_2]
MRTPPTAARHPFDVVVLAASAGGIRALRSVVAGLPATFPTPVLAVQHRAPGPDDLLTDLLRNSGTVPVHRAAPGPLAAGVHVLPPRCAADLTPEGWLALRPCDSGRCADLTMESAAGAFGPRVLAAVLTGRLTDGAAGVRAVRRAGGRVLAQDPADAEAPGMPSAALATGCVEHVVPLRLLAPALIAYAMAPGAADLLTVPVSPWARLTPGRVVPA